MNRALSGTYGITGRAVKEKPYEKYINFYGEAHVTLGFAGSDR